MSRQNYRDLTHEQLVSLLEARDRRAATRYGLVWETDGIEGDNFGLLMNKVCGESNFIATARFPELTPNSKTVQKNP